jgi:hypothetical protein
MSEELEPAKKPEPAEIEPSKIEPVKIEPVQWFVAAVALALAAGACLYRWVHHERLGQSSVMFLGIPAVLAIIVALTPRARTITGGIVKVITLALLIVAPLVGEGYLCILMAAPLFYVVGIAIGLVCDWRREKRIATLSCITLVMLPMCLEGVIPQLTWNRTQTVDVVRVVNASAAEVENSLAQSPRVNTTLPAFLRIGFPRPLEAHGEGLSLGARRTIHFAGAEGDPPGDLVMEVTERRPGYVRFDTVSDDSKLTQWLLWDRSEVEWSPIDSSHTRVTWRVRFDRQLDPDWYFMPLERAAVHEAARFLVAANATPEGSAQ